MRQLLHFRHLFFLSFLVTTVSFYSCNKEMRISLDDSNENMGIIVIDSMTINTSTFQLSNLPSAGTGTLLVGKSTQPKIGSLKSSSYFLVQLKTLTNDIPTNAVFDSINLVLRPNRSKYFYGDTTKVQTIAVHRVTEEIVTKDITNAINSYNTPVYVPGPTIFNNQKFNFDAAALGVKSFNPTIRSLDSISIRLEQSFGQEIYNMVRANDINVTSNESFQKYLKGLVLVPGAQNTAVLGLSDTLEMNVNYSYIGADGFIKKGAKVITAGGKAYQYNNIEYDRTGTAYAELNTTNREISSSATNGEVLLQSGGGLVAKMTIPSLNDFMHEEKLAVNKVELIIETTGNNYGFYPAPNALMLLIANSNGVPISYMRTPFSTSGVQQATFIPGNDSGVNGRYVFNLIDYIKNVNNPEYRGVSLLLSTALPALFGTANATMIATENGKPKIKLNIVYTKFK